MKRKTEQQACSMLIALFLFAACAAVAVNFARKNTVVIDPLPAPSYYIYPKAEETQRQETEAPEPATEQWIATAYCSCEKCCGKWALNRPGGIVYGSGGYELIQGQSMASALPYGTVITMSGAGRYDGEYICHDRPAEYIIERYRGKIIDVYFNSHEAAAAFGKRTVTVEIL